MLACPVEAHNKFNAKIVKRFVLLNKVCIMMLSLNKNSWSMDDTVPVQDLTFFCCVLPCLVSVVTPWWLVHWCSLVKICVASGIVKAKKKKTKLRR